MRALSGLMVDPISERAHAAAPVFASQITSPDQRPDAPQPGWYNPQDRSDVASAPPMPEALLGSALQELRAAVRAQRRDHSSSYEHGLQPGPDAHNTEVGGLNPPRYNESPCQSTFRCHQVRSLIIFGSNLAAHEASDVGFSAGPSRSRFAGDTGSGSGAEGVPKP
jgi:hypothetical protein